MEIINIINNTNTINKNTEINENTTLGELIEMLALGEKPHNTPTPRHLRENAGDPIATSPDPLGYGEGCLVYGNGYAVYDNGSGRTVVWLPDCVEFTYNFVKPKESEVGIVPEKEKITEEIMREQPWAIAVTLIGDHRVDDNLMNRTSSRTGTRDYDSQDNGDKDGDVESKLEKSYRDEYAWREGRFGENPEDAYLKKERNEEILNALTEKQREVFLLYYHDGYTQQEIGKLLGVSQVAVKHILDKAISRAKKFF